jgi:hypothetical protein
MSNKNRCIMCNKEFGEGVEEDTSYPVQENFMPDTYICTKCAKEDKLNKRIKEFMPFMENFSELVNRCGFDHDGIITEALVACFFRQHRYLQNEMIIALKRILHKIGKGSGDIMYEDPRNTWCLKWCKVISNTEVY